MNLKVIINVDQVGHLRYTSEFVRRDMAGEIANLVSNMITDDIMSSDSKLDAHNLHNVALVEGVETTQRYFKTANVIVRHGTENALCYKSKRDEEYPWDFARSVKNRYELANDFYKAEQGITIDLSVLIRDRKSFKATKVAKDAIIEMDKVSINHKELLVSSVLVFDEFTTIVKPNPATGKYDVDFDELFIDTIKRRAHAIFKYLNIVLDEIGKTPELDKAKEAMTNRFLENLSFDQADGLSLLSI